ncbi:MAG: hypothetical protein ACHQDF_04065 [Chitinophagales bacterium]
MKKLVLALAVILMAGLSKASANSPVEVNKRVINAFYAEFDHAKNVSWNETSKYIVAEFSLDNKIMYAYYKPDGRFVGIIHHLLSTDLPENLRIGLKKKYSSYWVSELFKVENDEGTSYYANLENGTESVLLSSNEYNVWNTYKITPDSEKESASF